MGEGKKEGKTGRDGKGEIGKIVEVDDDGDSVAELKKKPDNRFKTEQST